MSVEFVARVKAFSGEGVRNNRISVDSDGTVRVYDSLAGHYTTNHSLSKSQERKLIVRARKESR